MTGPDVYLLTAFEPYTDPRSPVPINAMIVHAATLLHRQVPQPDGGMIYRCLTEHPRQPNEIVPVSTLTFELDGGQLWPEVGDWQAVTAAVVRLARAAGCDAMPLSLPGMTAQMLAMGPSTVNHFYNLADGATEQRGPRDRQKALDELGGHLRSYLTQGPFWPGDELMAPPSASKPMPYKPWQATG